MGGEGGLQKVVHSFPILSITDYAAVTFRWFSSPFNGLAFRHRLPETSPGESGGARSENQNRGSDLFRLCDSAQSWGILPGCTSCASARGLDFPVLPFSATQQEIELIPMV